MARSPFQGTYHARPTVVTAPDAIVKINGEMEIKGCPSCSRRFNLNKYITSITVDLNVDSAPGSASISLSIPRHAIDEFYFNGSPAITPMMEVEIYGKGYFLVEGIPQNYPIFWGLVTDVSESFSGGATTISISCNDILKWWDLSRVNINPAFTQQMGSLGRNIFGNVFYGSNPYDVIWTLAQQSFGDVVIGTGSLVSLYKEQQQKKVFADSLADLMLYWENRFSKIRSNLLLYGTRGVSVRGDVLYDVYRRGHYGANTKHFAARIVRVANGGKDSGQMVFDPTDPDVVAYRTQFSNAGQVNFWQAEYQTKMEIANHAKEAIGYEFYMDVTGDIVFKPPFYNMDVLENKPVSWIQDIDIIDWNFSESESEVVTQLTLSGSYGGNIDYGFSSEVTPYTSVTDYHLLRHYGWRPQEFTSEFLGNTMLMFYLGLDMMDKMNAKRFKGTLTIPFRPELRLGFPIYLAPLDQFWYISGISHNISFGGQAQTSLTLTARREKFIAPKGMGTIKMTSYGNKKVQDKKGSASGGSGPKPDPTVSPSQNIKSPPKPKYTARQLAKNATFQITSEGAAPMPGNPAEQHGDDNNPYAPVILRHPKTGRIMGWPNVVMLYSRPFVKSPDTIHDMAGQGHSKRGTKHPYYKKQREAVMQQGLGSLAEQVNTLRADTKEAQLAKDHNQNRYTYGLTSAGMYIYAYDQSEVIQEFLLISKSRVKNVASKGFAFEGKTGMIRPVSDERGFEVIGHFRYGRGVSFHDGSLVLNEKGKNSKAEIATQVALSGDLTATLLAQSQGLTTVTSPYSNPAQTLSKLGPDDLTTAATINPETDEPEFSSEETHFIDTAPLGSPEDKGFSTSVEASQLSRAVTLAELSIIGSENTPPPCSCMIGRPGLSFMSQGYQVRTLAGSKPTMESLLSEETEQKDYNPVSPTDALKYVDSFLYGLYDALDKPHYRWEGILRGEQGEDSVEDIENARFGSPTPKAELEPPFSAPSRYAAGDPEAAVQQGSSARADLERSWSDFGDKLTQAAKSAKRAREISNLRSDIANLEKVLASNEAAVASGTGSAAESERIQQQINAKQQELENLLLEEETA